MATDSTEFTLSGTPVEFLPLPTPWPSGTGCSGYKYRQLDGHFLAWDPFYGQSIDTSARTCLPTEVSSWWFQSNTATSTALGPTFVCPEAYYAVQTALAASQVQQVFCCPSDYSLFVLQPATISAFPSQCTSIVQPGETISFMSLFQDSQAIRGTETISTVQSETVTVFGIPVNGFNVARSTSDASETTQLTTPIITPTPSATSTLASHTSSPHSSGPSLGTSVGASVGCVFAVLILVLCAFLFWRRRRTRRRQGRDDLVQSFSNAQGSAPLGNQGTALHATGIKAELYGDNHQAGGDIYELPAHGQHGAR